ncbi:MAG: hypothetical protein ACKO5K_14965 [Armatimonadota bacterium]
MRNTTLRLAATATLLVGASSLAHAQNLLTNASFELPVLGSSFAPQVSGTNLGGWLVGTGLSGAPTGTGSGVDLIRAYWQPQLGAQSIALNNKRAGAVSQTVALTANKTYAIDFFMSGLPTAGSGFTIQRFKTLDILFDNVVAGSATYDSYGVDGIQGTADDPTRGNMRWQFKHVEFTPTQSRNNTVTFFSTTTNTDLGPALDATDLHVMIPEPATGALALVGIGPLAWVLRRRRAR